MTPHVHPPDVDAGVILHVRQLPAPVPGQHADPIARIGQGTADAPDPGIRMVGALEQDVDPPRIPIRHRKQPRDKRFNGRLRRSDPRGQLREGRCAGPDRPPADRARPRARSRLPRPRRRHVVQAKQLRGLDDLLVVSDGDRRDPASAPRIGRGGARSAVDRRYRRMPARPPDRRQPRHRQGRPAELAHGFLDGRNERPIMAGVHRDRARRAHHEPARCRRASRASAQVAVSATSTGVGPRATMATPLGVASEAWTTGRKKAGSAIDPHGRPAIAPPDPGLGRAIPDQDQAAGHEGKSGEPAPGASPDRADAGPIQTTRQPARRPTRHQAT